MIGIDSPHSAVLYRAKSATCNVQCATMGSIVGPWKRKLCREGRGGNFFYQKGTEQAKEATVMWEDERRPLQQRFHGRGGGERGGWSCRRRNRITVGQKEDSVVHAFDLIALIACAEMIVQWQMRPVIPECCAIPRSTRTRTKTRNRTREKGHTTLNGVAVCGVFQASYPLTTVVSLHWRCPLGALIKNSRLQSVGSLT